MTVQDGKDESGFRAQIPQVLEETTNPFSVMVEHITSSVRVHKVEGGIRVKKQVDVMIFPRLCLFFFIFIIASQPSERVSHRPHRSCIQLVFRVC